MSSAVRSIATCVLCSIGCIAAGFASAAVSPQDAWYSALAKPSWMPPGWLFGVVWTVLYAMMGFAISLVLLPNAKRGGRSPALTAFAIQLALNLAWSPIFFRFHSPGWALVVILFLWIAIAWTVATCWSVNDLAGILLLPYWAWVTFAVALNAAIWRMN